MNGRKAAIATHNGVEDRGAVGEQCAVVLQAAEHHVGVGGMERDARVIHGDGEPGTSARPAVAAVGRSVDAAIGAGPELPRVARINDNGVPIAMDFRGHRSKGHAAVGTPVRAHASYIDSLRVERINLNVKIVRALRSKMRAAASRQIETAGTHGGECSGGVVVPADRLERRALARSNHKYGFGIGRRHRQLKTAGGREIDGSGNLRPRESIVRRAVEPAARGGGGGAVRHASKHDTGLSGESDNGRDVAKRERVRPRATAVGGPINTAIAKREHHRRGIGGASRAWVYVQRIDEPTVIRSEVQATVVAVP